MDRTSPDRNGLWKTTLNPNRPIEEGVRLKHQMTRFIPITTPGDLSVFRLVTARFNYGSFPLEPPNSIPVTYHKDEILKCENIIPTLRLLIVFDRRNRCCSQCSLHWLDP